MSPTIEYTYQPSMLPLFIVGVVVIVLILSAVGSSVIKWRLQTKFESSTDEEYKGNPALTTIIYLSWILALFGGFMGMILTTVVSELERDEHNIAQTAEWLDNAYGITLDDDDLRRLYGGAGREGARFVSAEYNGETIPVRLEATPTESERTSYTLTQQNTLVVPGKD